MIICPPFIIRWCFSNFSCSVKFYYYVVYVSMYLLSSRSIKFSTIISLSVYFIFSQSISFYRVNLFLYLLYIMMYCSNVFWYMFTAPTLVFLPSDYLLLNYKLPGFFSWGVIILWCQGKRTLQLILIKMRYSWVVFSKSA